MKSTISRWLRSAADRLAPPLTSNPATVLGALAPDIPRSQISALETFCGQQIEIPATTVYTVTAYRWGDLDGPSYPVGCYATEAEAIHAAQDEEADRGGKYGCEVVEWTIGVGIKELGGLYPLTHSASPVRIVRSPEA